MEITRDNFEELLPTITNAINEADFIAFDGEFSGLGVELAKFQFDSVEDRYKKLREGIRGFLMIQIGLCPFKWVEEKETYEAKPFNVYIFPRPFGRVGENSRFACQCGSLDFLASNGFDFNKFIHKGVSFLLPHDEERLKEEFQSKYEKLKEDQKKADAMETAAKDRVAEPEQRTPIPLKFKSYVEETCEAITSFVENESRTTLDLAPASGFKRKLIYEAVESRFPTGIYLEACPSSKGKFLRVVKGSPEEKKNSVDDKRMKDEALLDAAVGFSKVMRSIQKSGKTLVGHNMLLDVMLSVNQFFSPLPDNLKDFKLLVNTAFPRLIDTKLIACTSPLKDHVSSSVLLELKERMSRAPFSEPPVEFSAGFSGYEDNVSKCHEAGYDAFLTGYSFLGLATYLTNLKCALKSDGTQSRVNLDTAVLQPFVNKINITRLNEIPFMNIQGEDPNPNRDSVFCVHCDSSWTTNDIINLFSPYGFVFISWLDEAKALVALEKAERAKDVVRELVAFYSDQSYRVITYAQYQGSEDLDKYQDIKNVPTKKRKRGKHSPGGVSCNNSQGVEVKQPKVEPSAKESDPEDGEILDTDSEGKELVEMTKPSSTNEGNNLEVFEVPQEW